MTDFQLWFGFFMLILTVVTGSILLVNKMFTGEWIGRSNEEKEKRKQERKNK